MRGGKVKQGRRQSGASPTPPALDVLHISPCAPRDRSQSEPSVAAVTAPARAGLPPPFPSLGSSGGSEGSVTSGRGGAERAQTSGSSRNGGAHDLGPGRPPPSRAPPTADAQRHRRSSSTGSASASAAALASGVGSTAERLAFLYAAPLVNQVRGGTVDLLDFKTERDTLLETLRRAGKRVDISCEVATTRNLRNVLLDGCRVLHYSGHGFTSLLPGGAAHSVLAFEDGAGGTHALEVSAIEQLVSAGAERGGRRGTLEVAFVSACHSVEGGEAFVKAGVPHVIAVRRDARVQDRAACLFAEAFYYALLRANRTVRQAFEVGVQAVAHGTGIVAAGDESQKFLLLPESDPAGGADRHDRTIFDAALDGALVDLSRPLRAHNLPAFFPLQFLGRHALWQQAVAGVQQKRAVVLVGASGIGKTSLAIAAAHYLLERDVFAGGVLMISLHGVSSHAALVRAVGHALHEATGGPRVRSAYRGMGAPTDADAVAALLLPALRERAEEGRLCLILDGCDGLGLPLAALASIIERLLHKLPELSMLCTSTEPLVLAGVAQRQLTIPPIPALDAARLFVMLSPRGLTHAEIGSDRPERLAAEMAALVRCLKPSLPEIERFTVQQAAGGDGGGAGGIRVCRWKLADARSAEMFAAHLQAAADGTATAPGGAAVAAAAAAAANGAGRDAGAGAGAAAAAAPGADGGAGGASAGRAGCALAFEVRGTSVIARLSHLRLLAAHRVVRALGGSPRAIALAVHGLVHDDGKPRALDEFGALLEGAGVGLPEPELAPGGRIGGAALGAHPSSPPPPPERAPSERTQVMLEGLRSTLQLPLAEEAAAAGGGGGGGGGAGLGAGAAAAGSSLSGEERQAAAAFATAGLGAHGAPPGVVAAARSPAPSGGGGRRGEELPPSLEIDGSEVELDEWLGGGTFGAVFAGTYAGTRVAVKQFFARTGSHKAFAREANVLCHLRHPNVVQLLKVCRTGGKGLLIVTEFFPRSLFTYLHESTEPADGAREGAAPELLPRGAVLRLSRDIACGLLYLHTFKPAVLHRNLKSQNLMLDDSRRVKVADFGWSRFKDGKGGSGPGTFFHGWQWVAPEILSSRPYTEKADVYSFAMIMWEIQTRRLPFKGMNPVQIGLAVREQKLRPDIPADCSARHAQLMQQCWHEEPDHRPDFAAILAVLNELHEEEAAAVAAGAGGGSGAGLRGAPTGDSIDGGEAAASGDAARR